MTADWAEPKEEVDEEAMKNIKTIYIRNLPVTITEQDVRALFEPFGKVDRIALPKETTGMVSTSIHMHQCSPLSTSQKWKNFGFVYFETREAALAAIEHVHGRMVGDREIDVTLARPFDPTKAKRGGRGGRGGRDEGRGFGRGGGFAGWSFAFCRICFDDGLQIGMEGEYSTSAGLTIAGSRSVLVMVGFHLFRVGHWITG